MSALLQEKRKTRGLRINELVGEALDQDNTFYNHDTWNEDESDDSYSEEEAKPDVFDSDFNDTESDEDSDDEEEEGKVRKAERNASRVASAAGGKYKEPKKPAARPKVKDPHAATGDKSIFSPGDETSCSPNYLNI